MAPAGGGPNNQLDAAPGPDGVYGSEDDVRGDDTSRTPFPLVNGNSPFVVPSVVDNQVMTTNLALRDRPGTWPLIVWKPVSQLLGLPDTQSMMFTGILEPTTRPSPDELTLFKWLESGADGVNATEDDYTLFLYVVPPSTPLDERPLNCIGIGFGTISSLAQTRYRQLLFEPAVDTCFGTALCVRQPTIILSNQVNWFAPPADTSNGEADFVPLAANDVVFTVPSGTIEVNQGVPVQVPIQVQRQGGQAFPAGTQLTVSWNNGVVTCVLADGDCARTRTLAGQTSFSGTLTIDGDGTPSSGSVYVNVFVPNREVARGRITLEDRAETLVFKFNPSPVQLPKNGLPDISGGAPYLDVPFVVALKTSSTNQPTPNVQVSLDASYSQGPQDITGCRVTARQGVFQGGIYSADTQTNANGEMTFKLRLGKNDSGLEPQLEAQCKFVYQPSGGNQISGLVALTTTPATGTITVNRETAILSAAQAIDGHDESFVFRLIDQLGAPMNGKSVDLVCDAPTANGLRFATTMPATTNSSGDATLVVRASAANGSAFVSPVTCTLSADGVQKTVTLRPVLPAELVLTPSTVRLTAAQQVVGHTVPVTVTVRDDMAQPMAGVQVRLSCPAPAGAGSEAATTFVPVVPDVRATDAAGQTTLAAALTVVGPAGAMQATPCTVTAGSLSATFSIDGDSLRIFHASFE